MASSASSSGATTSTASTPEPQSSANGNGADAALIIDASDRNADLYYASGFLAGDPFTFVSIDGRRYLILSNLEYTRGTKESNVDEVVSYSELESEVAKSGTDPVRMGDVVMHFLRTRGVSRIEVPGNFPVATADVMRESGFEIVPRNGGAFFPERECKNADEITRVEHAQACTEAAMLNAIETIRRSDVVDGALVLEGEPLTSERLKSMIAIERPGRFRAPAVRRACSVRRRPGCRHGVSGRGLSCS